MEQREPERQDRRSSDKPEVCPKCGNLIDRSVGLKSHEFHVHGVDRREQKQEGPNPPAPKPKPTDQPKPTGDPPKPKARGWFSGRPQ